ncbi:MAG: recombinase family protein [Desulfomonilaceae bacterium]
MGQYVGYARVSTSDQDLSLQINDLTAAGCEPICTDKGVQQGRIVQGNIMDSMEVSESTLRYPRNRAAHLNARQCDETGSERFAPSLIFLGL